MEYSASRIINNFRFFIMAYFSGGTTSFHPLPDEERNLASRVLSWENLPSYCGTIYHMIGMSRVPTNGLLR